VSKIREPIGLLIRKDENGKEWTSRFWQEEREVFLIYALSDTVTGIWVQGGELDGASLVLELIRRAEAQHRQLDILMWSVSEKLKIAMSAMVGHWEAAWKLSTTISVTTATIEEFQKKWDAET
jgi:hypothetical protein